MCSSYGYSSKDENLGYEKFGISSAGRLSPSDSEKLSFESTYPGKYSPVIVEQDRRKMTLMRWGLIPFFAKSEKLEYGTSNARSETASVKPTFRKPFRFTRCLIPATHFFEWDYYGKKGHKTKYLFTLKSGEPFAFAGLWSTWRNPQTGKDIDSYTMMTTTANEVVKPIHPQRMPVILKPHDYDTWLSPDIIEPEQIQPLLKPYPASEMTSSPVPPQ